MTLWLLLFSLKILYFPCVIRYAQVNLSSKLIVIIA